MAMSLEDKQRREVFSTAASPPSRHVSSSEAAWMEALERPPKPSSVSSHLPHRCAFSTRSQDKSLAQKLRNSRVSLRVAVAFVTTLKDKPQAVGGRSVPCKGAKICKVSFLNPCNRWIYK